MKTGEDVLDIIYKNAPNAISASIGLVNPLWGTLSAVLTPIMLDLAERHFAKSETKKICNVYVTAAYIVTKRIKASKTLRNDEFFQLSIAEKSDGETIVEGILLKVKGEYEEKKLKYYANFLANICFDSSVTYDKANIFLKYIEQLSYRQLIILAYINKNSKLEMKGWISDFNTRKELDRYRDFYAEIIWLHNNHLLSQPNGFGLAIDCVNLSSLGNSIYSLMELNTIDETEIDEINELVVKINEIKSQIC